MTKVLFKMGNKNNLPSTETGSLIIAKDTKELFADTPRRWPYIGRADCGRSKRK